LLQELQKSSHFAELEANVVVSVITREGIAGIVFASSIAVKDSSNHQQFRRLP
jgi:hypothetical protein